MFGYMQSRSYIAKFLLAFFICTYACLVLVFPPVKLSFCKSLDLPVSIQDMINKAKDDDLVLVPAGTYFENVMINKTIKVVAEGTVTIIPLNPNDHVVKIISDDVVLQGFSIVGPTGVLKSGIYVAQVSKCHILSNKIFNCSFGVYIVDARDAILSGNTISGSEFGVYLSQVENGEIFNNYFDMDKYGLATSVCYNITAENNLFEGNMFGVYLHSSNDNHILANNVSFSQGALSVISSHGNKISANGIANNSYGILIDSSRKNDIFENFLIGNEIGLHVFNSDRNNVSKNNITSGINNVYLEKSRNLLIFGNCITSSKNNLVIDFCENVSVLENTIENASGNALTSFRSEGCKLVANHLRSNKIGITLDNSANYTIEKNSLDTHEYGIYLHYSSDNLILRNLCIKNSVAVFYSDGACEDNIVKNLEINSCYSNVNLTFSYFGEVCIRELESVQGLESYLKFLGTCFNLTLLVPRSWVLVNLTYNPSDLVGSEKSAPSLYLWTGTEWKPATESTSVSSPSGKYISTRLKESGTYAMLVELPHPEGVSFSSLYLLLGFLAIIFAFTLLAFKKRILKPSYIFSKHL